MTTVWVDETRARHTYKECGKTKQKTCTTLKLMEGQQQEEELSTYDGGAERDAVAVEDRERERETETERERQRVMERQRERERERDTHTHTHTPAHTHK